MTIKEAEEPNEAFVNINKFNLYPGACLALSDVFVYTTVGYPKAHETVIVFRMARVEVVCSFLFNSGRKTTFVGSLSCLSDLSRAS